MSVANHETIGLRNGIPPTPTSPDPISECARDRAAMDDAVDQAYPIFECAMTTWEEDGSSSGQIKSRAARAVFLNLIEKWGAAKPWMR